MKRIVALMVALLMGAGCRNDAPVLETTTGRDREWVRKELDAHLTGIAPDDQGSVTFTSTGAYRSGAALEPSHRFTLGIGQTFVKPDHHGSITFTVKKIGPDGIVIEYQNRFDARSFGENKVMIDEGEIELPYRK
jgi:hypothetical protein